MYTDFFSLTEKPFSITPDPAFLFLSRRHEEALAHLVYGVTDSGGFIQLTGEVGTGKTTIIRSLFEQLPENVDIALILNPRLSVNEFLHSICDELHIDLNSDASNKDCFDALNPFLLDAYANGRKVVLLVDEAQNLSVEVLEQIRLLTNLETHKDKLLQIILVGQPELQNLLQRQDLRQLAQRITARYYLKPLNKEETRAYIKHRLHVAGAKYYIFKPGAEFMIYKAAKGIPRLINVICDRALLGAFSQQLPSVDSAIAKNAISEVLGDSSVAMSDDAAAKKKGSLILRWAWVPVLAAVVFAAWQYAPVKNAFEKFYANTTQAQNQAANEASQKTTDVAIILVDSQPDAETSQNTSTNSEVVNAATDQVVFNQSNQAPVLNSLELDLASFLRQYQEFTTTEAAFNQLLVAWGRSRLYNHTNACNTIKALGLRCLNQRGAWGDVLKLNRPVILEIRDVQNTPHQLLVTSANSQTVTVSLPTGTVQLPLAEVLSAWKGAYLVLWQPERMDSENLFWGSNTPAVIWLREQLISLGMNVEPENTSPLFDSDLVASVKKFQESQGILADGIVGSQTFLILNNALNLSGRPTLNGGN